MITIPAKAKCDVAFEKCEGQCDVQYQSIEGFSNSSRLVIVGGSYPKGWEVNAHGGVKCPSCLAIMVKR